MLARQEERMRGVVFFLSITIAAFGLLVAPIDFQAMSVSLVSADHCEEGPCDHVNSGGGDLLEPRSEQEPEDGSIRGTKRNYDTESGLSGWQISLHEFWSQSDGYDEEAIATTTTTSDDPDTDKNEAGEYGFSNVAPGDYLVCEENREGWEQTDPVDGENTYECQNGTTGYVVTVSSDGSVERDNNFMNKQEPSGSIHGRKRNYDTESGLPGWKISLHEFWSESDGYDEDPEMTVETMKDDPETQKDESGMYWLEDVPFGDYLVCEENREGWMQTSPSASEDNTYQCENGTQGHVVSIHEEQARSEGNDFMNRDEPDYGGGPECGQFYGEGGSDEGVYEERDYGSEGSDFSSREEHRTYCECVTEEGYTDAGSEDEYNEEGYEGESEQHEEAGSEDQEIGKNYCECVAEQKYGEESEGEYSEAEEGDYYNETDSERFRCEQPGDEPDGSSDGGSPDSSSPGLPNTGDGSLAG